MTAETVQDPEALRLRIERHLSLRVRRFLDSHAGDVEVRNVRPTGEVELVFKGACTSCPALPATFYTAVAPVVREVPGVTAVTTSAVNISEAAIQRLAKISTKTRRSANPTQESTPMSSELSCSTRSVSLATARKLLDAAVEHATSKGRAMVIAVVDQSGVLKAFCRMDGAPLLSVQIAQDKAYSAAAFGMPTDQWYEFIKNDGPLLHGIVHTPRLTVFGGGFPIFDGGAVVGGIGVSGGHYTEDMEVGKAALATIGQ